MSDYDNLKVLSWALMICFNTLIQLAILNHAIMNHAIMNHAISMWSQNSI